MSPDQAAVARLYHAWVTGLILMVVTRRGAGAAAELVFRLFRRQHREKFLPGLRKLGLAHLPPAVAAAQYHYLSNLIGGVAVEYIAESDRKAWIRYPPPRWIWQGAAICGIPSEVSRAMLRGWHAENGVSLGRPGLGFVCTKQTVDGEDALEGYFLDHGGALSAEERLRFAPDEEAPLFDPAQAPRLPPEWTPERFAKARRNYAMDYVRNILPELVALFGEPEARFLAGRSAYLTGLQQMPEIGAGETDFPRLLACLIAAQGDGVTLFRDGAATIVRQHGWRVMADMPSRAVAAAIGVELWRGCLGGNDRRLQLTVATGGEDRVDWRITPA
jgi:hypothetical protein